MKQNRGYSELGAYLWAHLVADSPSVLSLGGFCNELGCSYSWPSGEAPRLSKGKKVIECSIENFVPVVAVTKLKAVPSIEFSSAKRNFEREEEVDGTMLETVRAIYGRIRRTRFIFLNSQRWGAPEHVIEENPLHDKLHPFLPSPPPVVTDARRVTFAKETKSKKGIIGTQPRGNHNVFTHDSKDSNCDVSKRTKTHEPGVG